MELQEALVQISAIRRQMARSEQFRGYRALPVGISALLAIAGGAMQAVLIAKPMEHSGQFLTLYGSRWPLSAWQFVSGMCGYAAAGPSAYCIKKRRDWPWDSSFPAW